MTFIMTVKEKKMHYKQQYNRMHELHSFDTDYDLITKWIRERDITCI